MATGDNKLTLETVDRDFMITGVFHAPRALVFKAWTEPKQMAAVVGAAPFHESGLRTGCAPRRQLAHRHAAAPTAPSIRLRASIARSWRPNGSSDHEHAELSEEWHDLVNPRPNDRG